MATIDGSDEQAAPHKRLSYLHIRRNIANSLIAGQVACKLERSSSVLGMPLKANVTETGLANGGFRTSQKAPGLDQKSAIAELI